MSSKKCSRTFVAILLTLAASSPALAYQFGPPPITELAETGTVQNRLNVYTQNTTFKGFTTEHDLTGLNGIVKTGDEKGATSAMYRAASFSRTPTGDGFLLGAGGGREFYLGADRSLGILVDGQLDLLKFDIASGATTTSYSQTAYGLELGALYRIFVNTATIVPFAMINSFKWSQTAGGGTSDASGSSTSYGVDLILGKFSFGVMKTDADYTITNSIGQKFDRTTSISMVTLGYNW